MPRLPGRESTQKTIPIDAAVCHSFLMPYEQVGKRFDKKVCAIEGCEHRIGACQGAGSVPAYVGFADDYETVIGVACVCCVDRIMAS